MIHKAIVIVLSFLAAGSAVLYGLSYCYPFVAEDS